MLIVQRKTKEPAVAALLTLEMRLFVHTKEKAVDSVAAGQRDTANSHVAQKKCRKAAK
jgi:hypothetical protein